MALKLLTQKPSYNNVKNYKILQGIGEGYYRGILQGKVMSPIAVLTSRSDVRAEPFYHGERIGSSHVRYEC